MNNLLLIEDDSQQALWQISIIFYLSAMDQGLKGTRVLVTGGTSGLGRSLVCMLLEKKCHVISIARSGITEDHTGDQYSHFNCDFADLAAIDELVEVLAGYEIKIDLLVNNAGILSPPSYQQTKNHLELTYQVNFLSHVYLTQKLIASGILEPACIVNVSSPIHTRGQLNLSKEQTPKSYSLIQAYANTKLYMAMFSLYLNNVGYRSFSFNPGTFSSGIYRYQKKWFHHLYKIASPFMIASDRVAEGLIEILERESWIDGKMMNRHGKLTKTVNYTERETNGFWQLVNGQLQKTTSGQGLDFQKASNDRSIDS